MPGEYFHAKINSIRLLLTDKRRVDSWVVNQSVISVIVFSMRHTLSCLLAKCSVGSAYTGPSFVEWSKVTDHAVAQGTRFCAVAYFFYVNFFCRDI